MIFLFAARRGLPPGFHHIPQPIAVRALSDTPVRLLARGRGDDFLYGPHHRRSRSGALHLVSTAGTRESPSERKPRGSHCRFGFAPPFPFTAFILATEHQSERAPVFIAMFAFRLVRFGAEAALATVYGRQLVRWMESDWFRCIAYSSGPLSWSVRSLPLSGSSGKHADAEVYRRAGRRPEDG